MSDENERIEALKELINIGVGRAAGILNTMLNSHITLKVPHIQLLNPEDFEKEMTMMNHDQLAAVQLGFQGHISGAAHLIFTTETASKLVTTLVGDDPSEIEDFDSIQAGTLSEIGNIVLNGIMGSISNMLKLHFDYTVPLYLEGSMQHLLDEKITVSRKAILLAQARFSVEKLEICGDIALFFEVKFFNNLLDAIDNMIEGN